jgi:hypothetical protein
MDTFVSFLTDSAGPLNLGGENFSPMWQLIC